ncbi:HAD family hydrolase [Anaerosacchariphilus polymeriproducens]|uniref:HAD family phosphatase n=1 Tax=Anaerosacchariphilus polymeriproducens TaxID=1812858 RepID=A0A371ATY7_9FIRM|nr:HAD family phosphatase [Anaerosacchariphilus polymeriproducens]RDU23023.1 HAD family phosphatase [Anaerosacchariphilus polymeriproducens]
MLQNKKAAIFDLDGTLVDSMWMWEEIDIEFLSSRGLALPESLQQEIEGMSFTETAFYFKEFFNLEESVEELKRIWNQMAYDKYVSQVPLKSGAKEFLNYLKEKNFKLGIATSNSKELVMAVIDAHNLRSMFGCIMTSCEVNKGKPAPDIYIEVAKKLEVLPEECIVFEDIPMGILAGKNANMDVCAVFDEFSKDQEDKKYRLANYYIKSYHDIQNKTYEVLKNEK